MKWRYRELCPVQNFQSSRHLVFMILLVYTISHYKCGSVLIRYGHPTALHTSCSKIELISPKMLAENSGHYIQRLHHKWGNLEQSSIKKLEDIVTDLRLQLTRHILLWPNHHIPQIASTNKEDHLWSGPHLKQNRKPLSSHGIRLCLPEQNRWKVLTAHCTKLCGRN